MVVIKLKTRLQLCTR